MWLWCSFNAWGGCNWNFWSCSFDGWSVYIEISKLPIPSSVFKYIYYPPFSDSGIKTQGEVDNHTSTTVRTKTRLLKTQPTNWVWAFFYRWFIYKKRSNCLACHLEDLLRPSEFSPRYSTFFFCENIMKMCPKGTMVIKNGTDENTKFE